MRFLWLVVTAILLSSCSAQWHLKRAIAKDPSLKRDTIVKIDTAIVTQEKILSDTLVVSDTIVREIKSDGVVIRLQRVHDTIKVEAICESDTIKIVKEVEVVRYIEHKKTSIFDKANALIRSLIALIVVAFFWILAIRILKK